MDQLKHILSGGYWEWEGKWICAGPKVRQVLHDDPFIQWHLGWVPQKPPRTGESNLTCSTLSHVIIPYCHLLGTVHAKPRCTFPPMLWSSTLSSTTHPNSMDFGIKQQVMWQTCDRVIAQSGNICRVGSWAVLRKHEASVLQALD